MENIEIYFYFSMSNNHMSENHMIKKRQKFGKNK